MASQRHDAMTEKSSRNGLQKRPDWMTLDKDSDTRTPVCTEIEGKIPKWLSGSLYRNGPGVFRVGNQKLEHLFDGFAVLHRFVIHDGTVKYHSRILDSDAWVNSCKADRLVVTQFATFASPDPDKSVFDKLVSYIVPSNPWELYDNTATNIVKHGNKLYAMSETPIVNEVDPETLLKKSQVNLRDTLAVHLGSAHPHFDADGTMYILTSSFNPASAYSVMAVPAKGEDGEDDLFKKATLLTTIPSCYNLHISYNHSFGMTAEHFVILEQPVALNILKVMTTNWRREGLWSSLVKFPGEKTVFRVIRRSDKQLLTVRLEAEPFFCFHFVNCFEAVDYLVVDLVGYSDINVLEALFLDNLVPCAQSTALSSACFRRYFLPINVSQAAPDVNLVTVPETKATAYMRSPGVIHCTPDYITAEKTVLEMPRINYDNYNGKKYRFVYGTTSLLSDETGQLVKMDLDTKKVVYWTATGYIPGEPVFVPKPGAKNEDDGVVLSPVLSELPNSPAFLLVLDAKTFKQLARAYIPCHTKMATSLHGSFVPGGSDVK